MLRASRGFKMVLCTVVLASAAAWTAVAQQPRKVDDAAPGGAAPGATQAPAAPLQPSRLLVYALDGTATLPAPPAAPAPPAGR
jgi:hypothetical protein